MKVSVIVPVYYAEPRLSHTLSGLRQIDCETLVIVDVPDPARESETKKLIDAATGGKDVKVIFRIGQRGFGDALRHGFSIATGDILVPVMADESDRVSDIPAMVNALALGLEVVGGSRYMSGGGLEGITLKQRLSRLYSRLHKLLGLPISDVSNAFKAYKREVIETIDSSAQSFDISVELTLKAHLAGFGLGEIPTVWTNRTEGKSHFNFWSELRSYGRWLLVAMKRPATRRERV